MIDISKELLSKYNDGYIGQYNAGDRVEIVDVSNTIEPWCNLKDKLIGLTGTVAVTIEDRNKEVIYNKAIQGEGFCRPRVLEECMKDSMTQCITVKLDEPFRYELDMHNGNYRSMEDTLLTNCYFVYKKI